MPRPLRLQDEVRGGELDRSRQFDHHIWSALNNT